MALLFYTTYISVDLAHHEMFHAKVGKGGIMDVNGNISNYKIANPLIMNQKCNSHIIYCISVNTAIIINN